MNSGQWIVDRDGVAERRRGRSSRGEIKRAVALGKIEGWFEAPMKGNRSIGTNGTDATVAMGDLVKLGQGWSNQIKPGRTRIIQPRRGSKGAKDVVDGQFIPILRWPISFARIKADQTKSNLLVPNVCGVGSLSPGPLHVKRGKPPATVSSEAAPGCAGSGCWMASQTQAKDEGKRKKEETLEKCRQVRPNPTKSDLRPSPGAAA